MKEWINPKGLINAKPPGRSDNDENAMLFTNIYNMVLYKKNREKDENIIEAQHRYMDFMRRGVWHKNVVPDSVPETHKGDLYLSRDQMFSYSVFSKLNDRIDHYVIWDTIKSNFFTYDNVDKRFNLRRIVRPKDWIFLASLTGSTLGLLLMPWYYLTGIVTVLQVRADNLSGSQLIIHNSVVDSHFLAPYFYKLFIWILDLEQMSPGDVLFGYYGEGHPISEIIKKSDKYEIF